MNINDIKEGSVITLKVPRFSHFDEKGIPFYSDEENWMTYRVSTVYQGRYSAKLIENVAGAFDNQCLYPHTIQDNWNVVLLEY